MTEGPTGGTHDWPPGERAALALRLLRGDLSTQDVAQTYALSPGEIEAVKSEFLATAEQALARGPLGAGAANSGAGIKSRDDVGIWVCVLEAESVAPCLFMQAACSDQLPLEVSAAWGGDGRPPKSFRKTGSISLLHGVCDRITGVGKQLHLFSAKVPDRAPFESETAISDWRLPVSVGGVVVLLECRGRASRLLAPSRDLGSSADRTLAWVGKHHLPLVVAAVGCVYDAGEEDSLRGVLGLSPPASIVSGPSLSRRLDSGKGRNSPSIGGSVLSLFGGGTLRFDSVYAGDVVDELAKQIGAQTS
jgi:hypothetical protein